MSRFQFGRLAQKYATIAGIVALLVVSLLVPATASAGGGPSHWAKAETPVFNADLTKVDDIVLKKDTGVEIVDYVRDASGAPVWVVIVSASDPSVDGYFVPFALLTNIEPSGVELMREFDALSEKVSVGLAANGTNDISANDMKWLRANIANPDFFPTLVYTAGTYEVNADSNLYRAKTTALRFLDKDRNPVSVPKGIILDVDFASVSDGFVLIMAPAKYAGAYIEATYLTETETPSDRKIRLDAAFDKPLTYLTWEELVYVLKTEMGLPDVVVGGCNGKCGGGVPRP